MPALSSYRSVSHRMQRHPVSLAIKDDGPEAVRADRVLRLEHLAAARLDRGDGFIEATLGVQIDERATIGRLFAVLRVQAAGDVGVGTGQEPDRHSGILLLLNGTSEDGGVEADRPVEVQHGNVNPNNLIGHGFSSRQELRTESAGPPERHRWSEVYQRPARAAQVSRIAFLESGHRSVDALAFDMRVARDEQSEYHIDHDAGDDGREERPQRESDPQPGRIDPEEMP